MSNEKVKPYFSDSQSRDAKFKRDTNTPCRVCDKANMKVRSEIPNSQKGTFTQQLECPNCGEAYPIEVTADRKTVVTDPHSDALALSGGPSRRHVAD